MTAPAKVTARCTAASHEATIHNYLRGCTCLRTVRAAANNGARAQAEQALAAPRVNPDCRARVHTPTVQSWRNKCRCPGALAAQEAVKDRRRASREAARELARETGVCHATHHGSRYAQKYWGCCCALAHADDPRATRPKMSAAEREWRRWRRGRLAASRMEIWALVRGLRDRPTLAERIAAVAILSQRGSAVTGRLTGREIGERIGEDDGAATMLRARRRQLAARRAERRLADVRFKAERVAAAQGRKERVRAEHARGRG